MKKKDNIVPPSKEADAAPAKEQAIRKLEAKLEHMKGEFNREQGEVVFNSNYEEALTGASNLLEVDRVELDGAYQNNKGGLVSSFKKTACRSDYIAMVGCGSIFSLLTLTTPLLVIADPEIWPLLFVSVISGIVSSFAIRDTVNDFKNRAEARQSIQDTVTEHQKRLSDMSPPKPT